jgi:hypothetical protein
MPGRLAAWRALSGTDQRRLLGLACGLPMVELSLRCLGARRTASWLARAIRPTAIHPPTAADLQQAERLAGLAAIAGRRGPLDAHCLSQALLVRALLRRRGLDAVLQVGVHREAGQFDAHAWVELHSHALAQMDLQHLTLQPPTRRAAALQETPAPPSDHPATQPPPGTGHRSSRIQPRQPLSALAGKPAVHVLGGREHQDAQVARLASNSGQRPTVQP